MMTGPTNGYADFFRERASFLEHEWQMPRREAEQQACRESLLLFVVDHFPEVFAAFEATIFQPKIN